jgi:hypothetical protein
MIHYLFVGHFDKDHGLMRLAKRQSDGAPRPVVIRPLDMSTIKELLNEKGVSGTDIPGDWSLGIEEEGFIICERHTHSRDAIEFIRELAARTGCDILRDGLIAVSPDELSFLPGI